MEKHHDRIGWKGKGRIVSVVVRTVYLFGVDRPWT